MTLRTAIDQYIDWQRERGAIFSSPAHLLRRFSRSVGDATDSDAVRSDQAAAFIEGEGPATNYRYHKHRTLAGFYRYALTRDLATRSPVPAQPPRRFPPKPPYIYSPDEVHRLLESTATYRKRVNQLEPHTLRTLVLLLYGTGLRRGEAQRLRLADVDLRQALLTVHATKFFKSRLVPLAPSLARALGDYAARRMAGGAPQSEDAAFLVNRDGTPLSRGTVHEAFAQLRREAGIGSENLPCQPRLHDLRHTFAVGRLTAWYRQGKDVQRLLPLLSTYLGHASVAATQVYLRMTPELLREACVRFERYAAGDEGGRHAG